MIQQFVYGLPLWALAFLILATSLSYVLLSIRVVRRMGWVLGLEEVPSATVLHAFVSVVYAVALALIVVNVQTDFNAVENAVLTEASKVNDLYRNLDGLDGPERARLQAEVRRYVDLVLDKEWPAENQGLSSEETSQSMDLIARRVIQLHPQTADAQVVQGGLLNDIDDVLDARRRRIFLGQASMGPVMWLIIAVGAFITVGFAAMFPIQHLRRQIAVMSMAATMVGLMIFLVVAMDRPLRGELSVQPDAFRILKGNLARLVGEP